MGDPYIDLDECVVYGGTFCEEAPKHLLPLDPDWAGAVNRCVVLQRAANAEVEGLLVRSFPQADPAQVADAADTIVRFGSWLGSLKGRPIDPQVVFNGAAPSSIARRRLPKMVGAIERMVRELAPFAEGGPGGSETVPGAAQWLVDLRSALEIATRQRDAQRTRRAGQANLSPELERARLAWLAVYVANKRVVEGILRHHDRQQLMPVIFDDLAESPRGKAEPVGPSEPSPAPST